MIRKVKSEDFEALQKICEDELGYKCLPDFVKGRIENLNTSREVVFVAIEEDNKNSSSEKVIGFVHAEIYRTIYFDDMINILGLAVLKNCHKKGYGKQLMTAAENWAKEKGIKYVRLNSGGTRTEAHKFYRAIGYADEKIQVRFLKEMDL